MDFLIESSREALRLILALDADLYSALLTTLQVSLTSTVIAALIALPLAFFLARCDFPGKRAVLVLLRTALAFPTVAVALCLRRCRTGRLAELLHRQKYLDQLRRLRRGWDLPSGQ